MKPMGRRDRAQEILEGQIKARYSEGGLSVYLWPEDDKDIDVWIGGRFVGVFVKVDDNEQDILHF